jgi:ribonucleoside-triphosphate reductase
VFHAFIGEAIDDPATCMALVKKIAEGYRIPYFTISPVFSVCSGHGYLRGEHLACPACGEETEVYARIVGYYRPVKNWNPGKKSEYRDRAAYAVVADETPSFAFTLAEVVGTGVAPEEKEMACVVVP